MDESTGKFIVICFIYFVFYVLTSSGSNEKKSNTKNSHDAENEPLDINSNSDKTNNHNEKNKDSSGLTVIYFQVHFDLGFSNKFKPFTKIYTNNCTVHDKKFFGKKCSYCICLN